MSSPHLFPSRRDWGLGTFIWVTLVLPLLLPLVFSPDQEYPWPMLLVMVPIFLLVGVVWFGTRYYLGPEELVAKVGPLVHTRVRLADIRYISPSRNWMASPANSLHRLRIAYGKWGELLVSPQREKEFLDLIRRYRPEVEISAERDYWPAPRQAGSQPS